MLVSGSDFYCGNSSGSPCQFALKSQIPSQYVHPSAKQCGYEYTHPAEKQCNYSVDLSPYALKSQIPSTPSLKVIRGNKTGFYPSTSNSRADTVSINFSSAGFSNVPIVVCGAYSDQAQQSISAVVTSVTTTSATITITGSPSYRANLYWVAFSL